MDSDSSITATTPAHASAYVDVVVTTPAGTAVGTYLYLAAIPTLAGWMLLLFASILATAGVIRLRG